MAVVPFLLEAKSTTDVGCELCSAAATTAQLFLLGGGDVLLQVKGAKDDQRFPNAKTQLQLLHIDTTEVESCSSR